MEPCCNASARISHTCRWPLVGIPQVGKCSRQPLALQLRFADGKTARASLGAIGPWSPVDQLAVLAAGLRVAILTLRGLTARLTAALWLRVNGAIASHHTAIAISGAGAPAAPVSNLAIDWAILQ